LSKQQIISTISADEWRGDSDPLGVTRGHLQSPLFEAFLQAGQQSGQGVSKDLNGTTREGSVGA
jgi:choline dehydrogenase|tara:strand:- start:373 stop:564 length:192 start_codon:yes stop_codon:yes gene_type:complete